MTSVRIACVDRNREGNERAKRLMVFEAVFKQGN